jgi:hypothetical protein
MAKISRCDAVYVRIDIDEPWLRKRDGEDDPAANERHRRSWIEDAQDIVKQVLRHVDAPKHAVSVESENSEVCAFCDREWEIDPEDGLPTCCGEAVEEWKAAHTHEPTREGE